MRKLAWILLLLAPCTWAADVTEKTECPNLYGFAELEPDEAHLPVVYNAATPVFQKGLSREDVEETKAIVRDTMGKIHVFFPKRRPDGSRRIFRGRWRRC